MVNFDAIVATGFDNTITITINMTIVTLLNHLKQIKMVFMTPDFDHNSHNRRASSKEN